MNNNYENLPAVLNANQLATALGISRAGAYQLLNTESPRSICCTRWGAAVRACTHRQYSNF